MAETLVEAYDKLTDKQHHVAAKNILKSSRHLNAFDENLPTLYKLSKAGYILDRKQIDFSSLNRIEIYRKLYEENKEDRRFILDIEDGITILSKLSLLFLLILSYINITIKSFG